MERTAVLVLRAIVAAGVLIGVPCAHAQWAATWDPTNVVGSPPATHHDLAYVDASDTLVLAMTDFFQWPRTNAYIFSRTGSGPWVAGPHPSADPDNHDVEIAFDTHRQVLVLYTGVETWESRAAGWTNAMPPTPPVQCADGALLEYDPVRRRTVLVGSVDDPFGPNPTIETWLWNGTDWTQAVGLQPPGAIGGGMAFDTARGEMVLLSKDRMQTWVFDGTNWFQRQPMHAPGPPCGLFGLARDPVSGLLVTYGGEGDSMGDPYYPSSAWGWDGSDWHRVSCCDGPPSNLDYGLVGVRGGVLMHGGWGPHPDSWYPRTNEWFITLRQRYPVRQPRILFASSNETANGTFELYTMDICGGGLQRITTNAQSEWGPAVAPDQRHVAYVDPARLSTNIYLTTTCGGGPWPVGNTRKALAVQWRDRSTLLYLAQIATAGNTRGFGVWSIGTNGMAEGPVYGGSFSNTLMGAEDFAVESHTGRVYIASHGTGTTSRIVSGLSTGAAPDSVIATSAFYSDHFGPAVSADGGSLAYCSDMVGEPGVHRLAVGPAVGGDGRVLSDEYCGNPSWEPGGKWIAYTRSGTGALAGATYVGQICVVCTNARDGVPLTRHLAVSNGCAFPSVYGADAEFRITGVRQSNTQVTVEWQSSADSWYTLQRSPAVGSGAWSNVPPYVDQPGVDGAMAVTDAVGTAESQIYRLLGR